MNITMKHFARLDSIEVEETDTLAISRFMIAGYRRDMTAAARGAERKPAAQADEAEPDSAADSAS